jgi:5-methylcytosine-specific restriction endonuclease McrA
MAAACGCNAIQMSCGSFQLRKEWNSGNWTEGRYRSFVTSTLRSGARRWPPKFETLNSAKTEKRVNTKTGRVAQHYLCNHCCNEFPAKDVQVDHIMPVVEPSKGFKTWDDFIDKLYCEKDNLQVLCKPCHLIKSNLEKQEKKNANK